MRTLRPRRSSRPWCRTRRRCGPRWSGRRRPGGNSTPFWAAAGSPARPRAGSRPPGASVVGAPVFLLLSLCSACRYTAAPGAWHEETGFRWRDLAVPRRGGPGFTELPPSRTGIRFTNTVTLENALQNRHLAQGGGVTIGDVDGDGLADVYLTSNEGANALYKNLGDWRFEDITARAGVALTGRHSTGAVFDQVVRDLEHQHFEVVPKFRQDYRVVDRPEYGLVSMQQRADPDGFYLNDGTGHFTLVPWTSGRFLDEAGRPLAAAPEYFALSAKFTDVDGDGAPDLYVCDDFEDPDLFWLNDGHGTFRAAPR